MIAKEITKMHEKFIRGKIDTIKPLTQEIKGELTVILSNQIKNFDSWITEFIKLDRIRGANNSGK